MSGEVEADETYIGGIARKMNAKQKRKRGRGTGRVGKAIDHAECYVRGNVHPNGLENLWCLLNRCLRGTHVSVEPFHLIRYLEEEAFRFNNRTGNDGNRFVTAVDGISGKDLTYRQLIGADALE